ncbi:hypothetical protein [uncultured Oxalicibacterium sp.]|uniref:hypothetical protein n=1 Tax=uncultured Oxalicibacterium sp. TaxID=1168540 RepID=UPI0025DE2E0D|nr:hypothetical protein [uncultured Oxalicibacterium sp.]
MSIKNTDGSNVLPFRRPLKPALPAPTPAADLAKLLILYDRLIALLRDTYDDGLDYFTDGLLALVIECRERLEAGMENEEAEKMLRDMRHELHMFPRNLRAILPGIGPRLGESLEYKLGIQFAEYEATHR